MGTAELGLLVNMYSKLAIVVLGVFGITAIVAILAANEGTAATDSVTKAIDFLKTACASGNSLTVEAEADGSIYLFARGAKGKFKFSRKDARGVVEGLTSEHLREDLKNQRDCMRPYVHQILDAILGYNSQRESKFPLLPKGFAVDKEGFVLRPDGKRICKTESSSEAISSRQDCKLFDGTWSPSP